MKFKRNYPRLLCHELLCNLYYKLKWMVMFTLVITGIFLGKMCTYDNYVN